jgi:hypothetical protein
MEAIFVRYRKAARQVKTAILNEFCSTCGYHRKHAVRLLNAFQRFQKPKKRQRGKEQLYRPEVLLLPLKRIWKAAYMPCSKRLKASIPVWLPGYAKTYGPLPLPVVNALLSISPATIDRMLKPVRAKYRLHGRETTKPGTLLKQHIPVKVNQWDEKRPGFLEADSVSHCGASTEGVYASTLDCVDYRHHLDRTTSRLGQGLSAGNRADPGHRAMPAVSSPGL